MYRLFDEKLAITNDFTYDGIRGGERWRKKVRGYFLTKCPELQPILDWTELMDGETITEEKLMKETERNFWMKMADVRKVAGAVWGFLGTATQGNAHAVHELAPELGGFEAWRLLVQDIHRSQHVRRGTLRRVMRNP